MFSPGRVGAAASPWRLRASGVSRSAAGVAAMAPARLASLGERQVACESTVGGCQGDKWGASLGRKFGQVANK